MAHEWNDVIQLSRPDAEGKPVTVNALVITGGVFNVPKLKPTPIDSGIRQEEHLTVIYLDPKARDSVHTGIGVQTCTKTEFGIVFAVPESEQPKQLEAPAEPVVEPLPPGQPIMVTKVPEQPKQPEIGLPVYRRFDVVPTREQWAEAGYRPELYDKRFVERDGKLVDALFEPQPIPETEYLAPVGEYQVTEPAPAVPAPCEPTVEPLPAA